MFVLRFAVVQGVLLLLVVCCIVAAGVLSDVFVWLRLCCLLFVRAV